MIKTLYKKALVYKCIESFLNDLIFSKDVYHGGINKLRLVFLMKYGDEFVQEHQLLVHLRQIANHAEFRHAICKDKMFNATPYTSFKLKSIDYLFYKQM